MAPAGTLRSVGARGADRQVAASMRRGRGVGLSSRPRQETGGRFARVRSRATRASCLLLRDGSRSPGRRPLAAGRPTSREVSRAASAPPARSPTCFPPDPGRTDASSVASKHSGPVALVTEHAQGRPRSSALSWASGKSDGCSSAAASPGACTRAASGRQCRHSAPRTRWRSEMSHDTRMPHLRWSRLHGRTASGRARSAELCALAPTGATH